MIDYSKIPESTLETLKAWISTGRPMGSFCTAVVSNDLRVACERADEHNQASLFNTVAWLYNFAPAGSWGSPDVLKSWPAKLRGEEAA